MRMTQEAGSPSLYPDLRDFCTQGAVNSGPSVDPPSYTAPRQLLPTAPPLAEFSDHLHHLHVPEEPEEDYSMDEEDDCALDFPQGRGSTGSHTTGRTQGNRLELEPDYDMHELHEDTINNLNLTAPEKKTMHEKNIEVPEGPHYSKDFEAWMSWRLQANKQLAAVILTRKGHHVHVRESEMRRKPLTRENVVKLARRPQWQTGILPAETTSLPESPYVMYGIPRINWPRSAQY